MSDFIPENDGFIPQNDQSGEAAEPPRPEEHTEPLDIQQPQEAHTDGDGTQEIPAEPISGKKAPSGEPEAPAWQDTVNGRPVSPGAWEQSAGGQQNPGAWQQYGAPYGAQQPGAQQNNGYYGGQQQYGQPPMQQGTFYNPTTGQYYYAPVNSQQPKKKMSKGIKIFLGCIIGLLAVLVICFAVFVVNSAMEHQNDKWSGGWPSTSSYPDDNNSSGLFGFGDDSSTPSQDGGSSSSAPSGNPDGPSIDLKAQPKDLDNGKYDAKVAFKKVNPSVVGVVTTQGDGLDGSDEKSSQGTGIVVSEDGYIVTNSHVIGDSKKYKVRVVFSEEEEYPATIIGYDTRTDLAVIKIDAGKKLTAAEFADSGEVEVGQEVAAIGNPGGIGFANSLTKGIISAVDRRVNNSSVAFLQTDAAINPGNSGGPLTNLSGQVIGINTIKIVDTEYEGMGFAIPSSTVKEVVDDIITKGYVSGRVRIGITGMAISSLTAQANGVPMGILIDSFSDDSPLPKQGVKKDDIITKIDGTEITGFSGFYTELAKYEPGDEVRLTIYRMPEKQGEQGKTFDVTIKLLEDKGETQNN